MLRTTYHATLAPQALHKWTKVPDDYQEIYQQVLQEMQQPDFVGKGNSFTAWSINPSNPI